MGRQIFFSEHVAFLKEKNVWGQSYRELTALFNDCFGTSVSVTQIRNVCAYRNLILGRQGDGTYHAIGAERIAGNGYVTVKIGHSREWRYKHHLIWEAIHGPIPDGHVLIFGDKNKYNFSPGNLILASKQECMVMSRRRLIKGHANLTRSGLLIARLYIAMRKRFLEDPDLGQNQYYAWLRKHRMEW